MIYNFQSVLSTDHMFQEPSEVAIYLTVLYCLHFVDKEMKV